MWLYSIILFAVSLPFLIISISIYKGNTDLIHDYHQTKVADKAAYGKAFRKAMLIISASLLLSGIVGLFGNSEIVSKISVAVLLFGILMGVICIILVQKKYNKGIF